MLMKLANPTSFDDDDDVNNIIIYNLIIFIVCDNELEKLDGTLMILVCLA